MKKFDFVIVSHEFRYNYVDKCAYYKFTDGYAMIIFLFIDDLLIFSTNQKGIFETKIYLISNFKMKDFCEIDIILDIKVKNQSGGLCIA